MKITISSTEAARRFGDCLAWIKHTGETFILTKNDKPVAVMGPLPAPRTTSLSRIFESLREIPADPGFSEDLERVNAADRPLENPWR